MGMFDFLSPQKEEAEKIPVKLEEVPQLATSGFVRYEKNPILSPDPTVPWRSRATFNPAAIYLEGKVHLLFRAQGENRVSTLGYASSKNGFTIEEISDGPVYVPRAPFELCTAPGWNSGCEDPRVTKIGNRLYLTYTAYDGTNPPRVAFSSISVEDFLAKNWKWTSPKLISPPGVDDKDACVVKKVHGNGLVAFHRLGNVIWLDTLRDLNFPQRKFLTGGIMAQAREDKWDNVKIGIAAPPLETANGWLLFYHGVSDPGFVYKLGAMLLDFEDPRKILARSNTPILEPTTPYETTGQVSQIVYSCGAVILDGTVFLYYGGGDTVIGVATISVPELLSILSKDRV